jgi:hypothetical protein
MYTIRILIAAPAPLVIAFFLASEIAPERKEKQATRSQRRREKEFFRLEYDCAGSCFLLTDTPQLLENSKIKELVKWEINTYAKVLDF